MSSPPRAEAGLSPLVGAALWTIGTLGSLSAMAVAIREVSDRLGPFEILLFRSLVGLLILAALLPRTGTRPFRSQQPRLQLGRNLAHFTGQCAWTWGIAVLPLAQVIAFEFTTPIWVTLLACLWLGERPTVSRLLAVALGFAGILIILEPWTTGIDPAALVVLGSALCYGLSHTATKRLTRTDAPLAILLWMTLVSLPLALPPALWSWVWPVGSDWPWLLVIGTTGLSAHYCMSRAFKLADAMIVVPMDFLRLPLMALLGFLLFGERLEPATLGGGLVICLGIWLQLRGERRR